MPRQPRSPTRPRAGGNRSTFLVGRPAIVAFLEQKWAVELEYRLIKEVWAFTGDRIAVRFAYEWHDAGGRWFRSHGNEQWAFDAEGLMHRREASINDVAIAASERQFAWAKGPSARRTSRAVRPRSFLGWDVFEHPTSCGP